MDNPSRPAADPEVEHHGHHSPAKRIGAGIRALEAEDYAAAARTFHDILEENPTLPDVRYRAGLALAMLGRWEEALEQLDMAVTLNPEYAEALLNRAIVLNELGRFDEARESFMRAGSADRRWSAEFPSELGNRLAVAHAKLGDLYLEFDRPARAAREYLEALEIRPTFLDIRSRLAEAYLRTGELERAGLELEAILQENPGFTSARVRLGLVLSRMGDLDGARREWERVMAQNPEDARARAYLAGLDDA